ncbi:MAG: UDP-N-acetylmuramate--L-alanine ligase [Myxococcota bacterium]
MPPETTLLGSIRHIHLVAAAGTGMGTLACMLAERGFRVTGSDRAAYPPMSDQLERAGIELKKGFAAEHVLDDPPDLIVIGNAVRRDNPEARAALESGIPYRSFPDAVQELFIRDRHSVVIAGTHGKTTCTSMLGHLLTETGRDPSVLVGGVAQNGGASFRLGEGEHFVVEGDEYDTAFFDKTPKFLHYAARSVLLTSCEFDHADIYESIEQIQTAFRELVTRLPDDGRILAATDVPALLEVLRDARAPVQGYGYGDAALWRPSDVTFDGRGSQFTLWRGEKRLARARIPLWGRHNVENALGSLALAIELGVDPEEGARALESFSGVRRRQELRGEAGGVVVIDDFAHHPTAVRETIAAMRARFPDRPLMALYEPRTNTSRRRFFEEEYVQALRAADLAIVAEVYRADEIAPDDRLRPEVVVQGLREGGTDAEFRPGVEDIIETVLERRSGRDVALVLSNGDFGGICERLLARLGREGEG